MNMERPEKLDAFMSCVIGTISNDKVRKILDEYISEKDIGDCVSYLGSVVGRSAMSKADMTDIAYTVLLKLNLAIG